jgi:flagellar basal-body rod protein FlgB
MFQGVGANFERYMTLVSERQKLVASNIANVDSPGYKTKDIDFHSEYENASGEAASVIEPEGLPVKADGNNVSLDREARLLGENALRFSIASNFARSELSSIKAALQDGKGAS